IRSLRKIGAELLTGCADRRSAVRILYVHASLPAATFGRLAAAATFAVRHLAGIGWLRTRYGGAAPTLHTTPIPDAALPGRTVDVGMNASAGIGHDARRGARIARTKIRLQHTELILRRV